MSMSALVYFPIRSPIKRCLDRHWRKEIHCTFNGGDWIYSHYHRRSGLADKTRLDHLRFYEWFRSRRCFSVCGGDDDHHHGVHNDRSSTTDDHRISLWRISAEWYRLQTTTTADDPIPSLVSSIGLNLEHWFESVTIIFFVRSFVPLRHLDGFTEEIECSSPLFILTLNRNSISRNQSFRDQ